MIETALLISSLLLWGFIHSFLASLKVKEFIKNKFGDLIFGYYRLFYNIFALISFFPIIGFMASLPDKKLYAIPLPWVVFSLIIQALSLVGLVIGLKQTGTLEFLGFNVLIGVPDTRRRALNKSGLYKYVRHPLYSAGLILLWLSPVMTTNSLTISICLTIYICLGAMVEERKLIIEFGEIYLDYQKQVPMFFPRLMRNKKD